MGVLCVCVGVVPILDQFFTPTVCSTSENSLCKEKALSVYIALGLRAADCCVPGFALVRVLLHGENVLGHTGWGSRYCWSWCSLGNRNALVCGRLEIHGLWQGRWLRVCICCLPLGAVLCLWFPKHPPWTLLCYFHRLLPMEPPTPLVNAAFPVWAALSFVCVSSRARALLKLTETESITMASSVLLHVARY